MPLIEAKNEAQNRVLTPCSATTKKEFRYRQRVVKRAVDEAREEWIRKVAVEGERAVKTRWECIRRLQQAHAGCRLIRPSAVRKESGELTRGPVEVLQRWHQHFSKLLNEFVNEVIQQMPILSPCLDLDEPPSEDELEAALSKMRRGKAGGKTGILPEMVLCG